MAPSSNLQKKKWTVRVTSQTPFTKGNLVLCLKFYSRCFFEVIFCVIRKWLVCQKESIFSYKVISYKVMLLFFNFGNDYFKHLGT